MLYDPHRRWAPRGICRPEDLNLFFARHGQPDRAPSAKTRARWAQAKEICAACPVLAECRRDTLGEEYGVFGGLDEHERYRVRRSLSQAVWRWPEERRLAWAQEIHRLRMAGLSAAVIRTRTGIPQGTAEKLNKLWAEHLEKRGSKGQVVNLELPEPNKTPFPVRSGQRHAWTRDRAIVRDAWYRGETPDGEWICVTTTGAHGGGTIKWFPRDDVHLYQPQPVVILNRYEKGVSRAPAA
ncbi:WhiB family transcriptional regulator [Streptomyces sp. NBC_00490]|uniref:WhiB family transcriptional regulator n=1 Tax=Streptomyces sp. NBC_00490 TaxID=2903657 RepID=UPI002E183045